MYRNTVSDFSETKQYLCTILLWHCAVFTYRETLSLFSLTEQFLRTEKLSQFFSGTEYCLCTGILN